MAGWVAPIPGMNAPALIECRNRGTIGFLRTAPHRDGSLSLEAESHTVHEWRPGEFRLAGLLVGCRRIGTRSNSGRPADLIQLVSRIPPSRSRFKGGRHLLPSSPGPSRICDFLARVNCNSGYLPDGISVSVLLLMAYRSLAHRRLGGLRPDSHEQFRRDVTRCMGPAADDLRATASHRVGHSSRERSTG